MSRFWSVRGVARLALMLAGMVLGVALVQPAAAQDVPYIGIVVEDNAEVRAGAARNFYVVNRLPKDTLVRVEDVFSGWVMIEPPEGTYSIISRAHVDAKGDGSTGVVNSDKVYIRAVGLDLPVSEWYRTHASLKKGDVVQIVGEVESFYKIVSPKNAWVYLAPGTVRRATPAEIARLRGEPAPEPQPQPQPRPVDPAPQPAPTPRPDPTPVPPQPEPQPTPVRPEPEPTVPGGTDTPTPTPKQPDDQPTTPQPQPQTPPTDESGTKPATGEQPSEAEAGRAPALKLPEATSPAVREAEAKTIAAEKLPVVEQPIDELLATYKALQKDPELSSIDRYIVNARIAQLERNKAVADILKRGTKLQEEMASRPTVNVRDLERQAMRAGGYAATGRLAPSTVYNGENLPRLYRVVDSGTGRTIAYVKPGPNVDARIMGKLVGIYGQMRYDPALKLNLIDVQEVEVLEAQGQPTP